MAVKLYRIQRPLSSLESMCPDGSKDIEYYEGYLFDSILNDTSIVRNTLITVIKYNAISGHRGEYEERLAVQIFRRDEFYGTQFREPTQDEMREIVDCGLWKNVEKIRSSDDGVVHLYRFVGENRPKRLPVDRPWSKYPIGTKAYAFNGGHWTRVPNGWKWFNGSTFPTPGADAIGDCIELPATSTTCDEKSVLNVVPLLSDSALSDLKTDDPVDCNGNKVKIGRE